MNMAKKAPKRWRLNYTITYLNKEKAEAYRRFVHDTLAAAAMLRRIDYAIEVESSLLDDIRDKLHTPCQDLVCDIVRFRSSAQSLSSVKEFRAIIDGLFQGYDTILSGDPFEVQSQLQKYLQEDKFPDEFCRPLSYPYVEVHSGEKTTLCVTASSLQDISDNGDDVH